MVFQIILLILSGITITECNKRCFECTDLPTPSDCKTVIECPDSYECYVRKFITSGGLVLYNSGCHSRQRCQQLAGRRRSDLLVCEDCCAGELCNNAGCGATVQARPNRGPYCFVCASQMDPRSCRDIEMCEIDEWCSIEFEPHTNHYVSKCRPELQCAATQGLHLVGKRSTNCISCCADDFCNDNCTESKPLIAIGSWSVWTTWTSCSVTCGQGLRSRTRNCNGGTGCVGDSSISESCALTASCVVTTGKPVISIGSWSEWTTWTSCSLTCGQGVRSRARNCNGGTGCVGDSSMAEICSLTASCVVTTDKPVISIGSWSEWNTWTSCSVTCGLGIRSRTRNCNGGTGCVGDSSMAEKCSLTTACALTTGSFHGIWSNWSGWSTCSQTCGVGNKYRTRSCNGQCVGQTLDLDVCRLQSSCNQTSSISADYCKQKGFHNYEIDGRIGCLKLIKLAVTWTEGKALCHDTGAKLFTAENSKKQHVMDEFLTRMHASGKPFVWLGLHSNGHQWLWEGKPPYPLTTSMFNNFEQSSVIGHTGAIGCAVVNERTTGSTFYWYMRVCTGDHYVLCEMN